LKPNLNCLACDRLKVVITKGLETKRQTHLVVNPIWSTGTQGRKMIERMWKCYHFRSTSGKTSDQKFFPKFFIAPIESSLNSRRVSSAFTELLYSMNHGPWWNFHPNENSKFGQYLEEIENNSRKNSFRIAEEYEINDEFQIELQLKNGWDTRQLKLIA